MARHKVVEIFLVEIIETEEVGDFNLLQGEGEGQV